MKLTLSNILKLVISLSLGVGIIWYMQRDLSPEDIQVIQTSLSQAKWPVLLLASLMGVLAVVLRAMRWKMMLEPMGYSTHLFTLVRIIFIMYIANLLFPRLGEVLRCTLLQRYENVPLEKGLGTMVMERMIDVVCLGIVALIGVLLEKDKFIMMYQNYQLAKESSGGGSNWIFYIFLFLILSFIIILAIPKTRRFIFEKLKGLMDGILSIRNLKNPSLFIVYSLSIFALYLLTTYVVYFAIDGTSHMSFASSFVVLTTGTLGVGLTQGGLGAFQLLVTKTLELYNIPTSIGLSYAWISWLVQTFTLIFFGIASWVSLSLSNREQKK